MTTTGTELDKVVCEAMLPSEERRPVETAEAGRFRTGALLASELANEEIPAREDAKLPGMAEVGMITAGMLLDRVACEI